MKIPIRFKSILDKNPKLNGIVTYTVSQYDLILTENKLYFFEEYTDHGIKHIESVLESSDRLITDNTFENILTESPDSVGVYILSVILHDIGMHITPEGLYSLISGNNDEIRITELDSKTWKELWNEFLDETRRYGDKEKNNVIGNIHWHFRVPDLSNKDSLNGEDKKLIGEFIRLHHSRLAHEIALNGFPTQNNNIPFASELDLDIRDLCGLVARSHGVSIRNLFDYLTSKFQETWVKPYNLEIIYLMVVLRIADYFQIDTARTPEIIVKLKTFNSPISQIEHYKHLDVKYVQTYSKDPETIIFQCEPRNSLIFIKLKELFGDIQKELDKSWAILGEIYGKEKKEVQPTICFRRVKSNIDNTQEYSKRINYIPEKISFNVSNELPKLLIGPLYGNDPTYGVRELLQNAVDSCREREFLEKSDYAGIIRINFFIENEKYYFKIEDNGLGMTLNVVKNYFLEVGSSLRKSSLWKKTFSTQEGKSKVQRSGKFGIGVLASFLIGERMHLETKDSNSKYGLSFSTDLNSEQIEITKIEKENIGTVITIQIDEKILQQLKVSDFKFDKWYNHNSPSVVYQDDTKSFEELGYLINAPGFKDDISHEWNTLKIEEYDKIIWTYNSDFWEEDESKLTCNGILIPEAFENEKDYYDNKIRKWVRNVQMPYVSVFDFNGTLPLNLSRNKLDGHLPFKVELERQIYNDIIAKLLVEDIVNPFDNENKIILTDLKKLKHPAIGEINILYSKEGFILKTNYFIQKNNQFTLLKLSPKREFDSLVNFDIKGAFVYIVDKEDMPMSNFQYQANLSYLKAGGKMYLDKAMYYKLIDDNYNRYPIGVRRNHLLLSSDKDNVEMSYNYDEGVFRLSELSKNTSLCNYIYETHLTELIQNDPYTSEAIFEEQLNKYLTSNCLIPYDIASRKIKFSSAFDDLGHYQTKYIA